MEKLLLVVLFVSLFSCRSEEVPSDVAARASGRYDVQTYVVYGDTLYTSKGINKIGVSEFYIIVDRKQPDSVRVGSFYRKIGDPGFIRFTKDVGVKEANGSFRLSAPVTAPSVYESTITGNTFYERAVGGGFIVLPSSYSLKTPVNPALEGVIISARK